MIVNNGVCRNATIQLMLIEVLDVLRMLLKILQGIIEWLEIRNDPACNYDFIVCIGRDCYTRLHHFQPIHKEIGEKYRGIIKAWVNLFDGVDFQPVAVNCVLKGIG